MLPSNSQSQITVITAGGAGRLTSPSPPTKSTNADGKSNTTAVKVPPEPPAAGTATTALTPQGQNPAAFGEEYPEKIRDNIHNLEIEDDQVDDEHYHEHPFAYNVKHRSGDPLNVFIPYSDTTNKNGLVGSPSMIKQQPITSKQSRPNHEIIWLIICFLGIMASFVCYGLLLEYTTSGGRQLHELSFLFVTSGLYTLTAAAGRYVRDETPSTIPPARFAILGVVSMGSTFCSVRSLRYVIFPIQVLAKSCKPVPVMLMGAVMGKRYPARKYLNVAMIVLGVALFMGGGSSSHSKKPTADVKDGESSSGDGATEGPDPRQLIGILLLFISLCFDGGTGAYEDKLMSVYSVEPFDLMYNIQLGKTILAGIGLLVLNQLHIFLQMVQEMGFLLVALGLSGALGQVFIFVTIAKFGALTCSIIGLARKVTTLVASIYFYGHHLNGIQVTGLALSITSMVMNFWTKKDNKKPQHATVSIESGSSTVPEELERMLQHDVHHRDDDDRPCMTTTTTTSPVPTTSDVELATTTVIKAGLR